MKTTLNFDLLNLLGLIQLISLLFFLNLFILANQARLLII